MRANEAKLFHVVRFTDYELGPVKDWLQGKGFQFKEDMRRRDYIDLDVGERGLVLEAKRRAFGFMPNESVNVPEFTYVEIDWGVNKFPVGASYEQGVRNEAIMVFIFMGDQRQPSGSLFIPDRITNCSLETAVIQPPTPTGWCSGRQNRPALCRADYWRPKPL